MGHIRESFGRITIESRSESFYIHPSYGYRREYPEVPLSTIPVGECFRPTLHGEPCQVIGQLIGATLVKPANRPQEGDGDRVAASSEVMVHPVSDGPVYEPDSKEVEADGPLAKLWRDHIHPEFLNEDIDDLIAALQELRDSR